MTVPLARSTAEYLCTVHNELGPEWFRTLAVELTAPDERLRMRDMGECDFPKTLDLGGDIKCHGQNGPKYQVSGPLAPGVYFEEDASGAVTIHDSRPAWTPIERRAQGPRQMRLGAA